MQWVSESDSPVQRSVGREGEQQEKLTFVILKKGGVIDEIMLISGRVQWSG